ncbi:glycosyltransferase family 2 protein [Rhizobiaceae sp. 2RAB30]
MPLLKHAPSLLRTVVSRWRTASKRARSPAASPMVSVVVPAYDAEIFLEQCLQSVATQNHGALECIVVDDGSRDRTAQIIRQFIDHDSRFHLISHPANRGLAAARNSGLQAARGALIAFLDADDYLYQNSIADRVMVLERAGDGRIAGSYAAIHSVPEMGLWWEFAMPYLRQRQETVTFLTRGGENPFPVHAPLIRRDILERFGGFDETLGHGCEDWDFWQRILRAGYRFLPTGTVGGAYRMRRYSMRLTKAADHSLAAATLLTRAYREAEATDPPPFFDRPLGFYQGEAARIRRLVRGIAIASVNGDEFGRRRCLAELPAKAQWPLWVIDLTEEIEASLLLAVAGDRRKLAAYAPQIERIEQEVAGVLD